MKTLYHQDMYEFDEPIKSYWENIKPEKEFKSKTLENNTTADIVVIGAGYTGLSCALQLFKQI